MVLPTSRVVLTVKFLAVPCRRRGWWVDGKKDINPPKSLAKGCLAENWASAVRRD